MFKSIFSRLLGTYLTILIIVFTVMFGAMTGLYLTNLANRQFDEATKAAPVINNMTIAVSESANDFRVREFYHTTLRSWSRMVRADITVVDSLGDVYTSTAGIKNMPDSMVNHVLSGQVYNKYTHFKNYYPGMIYAVGIPMEYNGSVIGAVFFNTEMKAITNSLGNFSRMFLISCLISVIIAVFLIFFQTRKISKPIRDINSGVLAIASGKFDKRLPVTSNDETGQLASSFNYMASSLEQLDKMRESFISDVSHELRTPMTSISGFVGGILDGTIPPEKHREYLEIVYEESNRLSKMTSDMLEMSKMSSSEYKLDMKKFDICETVRLAIISLENKIEAKSLDLDVDFQEPQIKVVADKDSILRVVINLLDNAIKFSYENTKISINVWYDSSKAYVRVGNFGIGIEEEDLEHIFDRFYKTDKSRGRDKTGAGLGLSMAKNIMQLHNKKIWAESTTAKEGSNVKFTTFTFELERA